MHITNPLRMFRGRHWLAAAALLLVPAAAALSEPAALAPTNLARLARGGGPLPEGHAVAVRYSGTV